MEPVLPFRVTLPPDGSRTLLRSLHEQLRSAIIDGRLQPGLRLPATRTLADFYGVSRNTALAAYDLLLSEGYVVTRPRSGAYVADALPRGRPRKPVTRESTGDRRLNAFWREPPRLAPTPGGSGVRFDFRLGIGDKALFPFDIWRRLAARSLRTFAGQPATWSGPRGRPALREAIARHISFARAVSCSADDVLITNGSQQAFDLLAKILVTPGRTVVALENPGYPAMRAAFAAAGAKVASVPVDSEGMRVERLPGETSVICVAASHQFPLGVTMSMRRRAALLELARARNAVIIEDDYDGEFRFGDRPVDALQTLDRDGDCVFYVGTFSKSLFPGMRLGFVVAPAWAQRALVTVKQCTDQHSSVMDQDTLAAFIAEGHLARHVRKMRRVYAGRRELMLNRLEKEFGRWLKAVPSVAGMHVAALAAPSIDVDRLVERARERDVGVYPIRPYFFEGPVRQGLVLGYGSIDERGISEGLTRLRRVLVTLA